MAARIASLPSRSLGPAVETDAMYKLHNVMNISQRAVSAKKG